MFRHRYFVRIESVARFMSHLDRMRYYVRLLRRARLPVAFSEGFNPRPRIATPLALAVGHESEGEILEVDYEGFVRPDKAVSAMRPFFIEGLEVYGGQFIPGDRHASVDCIVYIIELLGQNKTPDVRPVLAARELPVVLKRKGRERTQDARPLIRDLVPENGQLRAVLAVTAGGTLKVTELLDILGLDASGDKYLARRSLVIKEN